LKIFAREHGLSFLSSFFSFFRYLDTCPYQERHLQELGAFIPNKFLFVFSPSVGGKHFWWMENM
jgi:hypothetical protein